MPARRPEHIDHQLDRVCDEMFQTPGARVTDLLGRAEDARIRLIATPFNKLVLNHLNS